VKIANFNLTAFCNPAASWMRVAQAEFMRVSARLTGFARSLYLRAALAATRQKAADAHAETVQEVAP
jgi:hypothetical protein